MTLSRFGNFLAIQGDNLVVGRMLGAGPLGIYGRAYQFMAMPSNLLGNALDKALFPAMSKVQTQPEKLAKAYLAGVGMISMFAIPTSVLLVLLANEIVVLLLGADWLAVVKPLQILSVSLLFRMSYKMTDPLARAVGAVYERAWRQWIYAGLILVGASIGQLWNLEGVATGVAIALFINFLMMAQLSRSLAGFRWEQWLATQMRGLLLGAVTVAIGTLSSTVSHMLEFAPLATLLFVTFCVILSTSVLLLLFPTLFMDSSMREMGKSILKKITNKRSASYA
jgi:PST family polysaccharide transporter